MMQEGVFSEAITKLLTLGLTVATSVVTALLTIRLKSRSDYQQWVAKEVCDILNTIKTESDGSFKIVLGHFLGANKESIEKSRKNVAESIKVFQQRLEGLKELMNDATYREVREKYDKWYAGVLGEEFPIQKKANCFKPSDPRIREREQHHATWSTYLERLRARCIKNSSSLLQG